MEIPDLEHGKHYILDIDGVDLPIRVSNHMILAVHNNKAGVLLILLSVLASYNINISDLQLGTRGCKGYVILSVDGDKKMIKDALLKLGPQFDEVSHLVL